MQINYNKRINDIFKRIDNLNMQGLRLVFDMITDLESDTANIYYRIKVLDRHNNIIKEETIKDTPREYIDKYIDKYNMQPRIDRYNVVNGKLVYIPRLAELDTYKNDVER